MEVIRYISSLIRRHAALHANNSFRVCSRSGGGGGGCCDDTRSAGMRASAAGRATVIGGGSVGTAVLLTRRRRRSGPCLPLPGTEPETTMMNSAPLRSSSINLSRMGLTDDSIFHRQRRPAAASASDCISELMWTRGAPSERTTQPLLTATIRATKTPTPIFTAFS